jgi:hypothetical protein
MTNHAALIARLCEASEGSADLSRQFWVAMGAVMPAISPCVTTSLSAAWDEAEMRGYRVHFMTHDLPDGRRYKAVVRQPYPPRNEGQESARTPALALCAALLAAEGERS